MDIRLSKHAKLRCREKKITFEEVRDVIIKGMKWREGDTIHAKKGGIEAVYKVANRICWVITAYYV